jgi:hypothetical protein
MQENARRSEASGGTHVVESEFLRPDEKTTKKQESRDLTQLIIPMKSNMELAKQMMQQSPHSHFVHSFLPC